MGQPLPLPERVPLPSDNVIQRYHDLGFKFFCEERQRYAKYEAPAGWHLEDKSHRDDIPLWVFVDTEGNERVCISGAWKGTYDNVLNMVILNPPYKKYAARAAPSQPAEDLGKIACEAFIRADFTK